MKTPPVVSAKEWEAARENMLVKEKEMTRAHDALMAERRRMPWMAVEKAYSFEGPEGKASLLDDSESIRFQPALEVWNTGISMTQIEWARFWKNNCRTWTGSQGIGHLLSKKRKEPGLKSRGPNFMNPCPDQDDQDEDRDEPMILG